MPGSVSNDVAARERALLTGGGEADQHDQARARLAAIVDSSTDAIISKDLNGIIQSWNAAAERLFGYTAEETIGRSIILLIPPDRIDEESQILASIRRGERVEHYETIRRRKDGTLLDVSLSISPIVGVDGTIIGASKIARDITQRKRAEERERALLERTRSATAKFEAIFNQSGIFAGIMDLEGYLREVNDLAVDSCGYTRDEVLGHPFWQTPWWRGSELMQARIRAATQQAAAGQEFREVLHYWLADGRERIVDFAMHPIRDHSGAVRFLHPTGIDITDRKRVEETLRNANERLQLLSEAAAVLLSSNDPDKLLGGLFQKIAPHLQLDLYFNFMVEDGEDTLRLQSCRGIPEETVAGIARLNFHQAICGTVAAERRPIVATFIQESLDPKAQLVKSLGVRAYACNPLISGTRLLGTLSFASRLRDQFDADEIAFLETISHYVTAAYERIQFIQALREADRRKDEFLATLAHELRNPLAPIRTGLEVMKLAMHDPATLESIRSTMERQTRQLITLVDDILDVSRITRGKLELKRCRVNLADVVRSAVEASRPLIDSSGHELTVDIPGDPVSLDADPHRLAQVLANLLNNAAKYTPEGGRIRLSAARDNGQVVVAVQDTGVGIPADMRERIFEMFAQIERPMERGYTGLGIGLTLVKSLVEMHHGTIEVHSDGENQGSEFRVRLPLLADEPAPLSVPASPRPPVATFRRRVLVVDDNKAAADMLGMIVQMLGHEVRTIYDGQEAVEVAPEFAPDVVLMDIGMPRMNGYEAARHIREQPWGRNMLLVALTGWGQAEDKRRTKEAGFDHHLVKPAEPSDLQRLLAPVED